MTNKTQDNDLVFLIFFRRSMMAAPPQLSSSRTPGQRACTAEKSSALSREIPSPESSEVTNQGFLLYARILY